MVAPIVEVENLSRTLGGEVPVTLLRDVSLTISAGEFVIITGPSGSGKSSLLYLLGLLDLPTTGRVLLHGKDTGNYDEDTRAATRLAELGFVFQFHFLLPEFTALENVMLPMKRLGKLSPREMRDRATSLLDSLGLGTQMNKLPKQLSGGQSQRVAIARALANDPLLILADEPTGNLDSVSTGKVREILRKIANEDGRAVVTVTHDSDFARRH
jgi:lipoprotein-releasing system ATP-binding protein